MLDPNFFAGAEFAGLLRPVGERLPSRDTRDWVLSVEALAARRADPAARARINEVIGGALARRAAAPLDDWSRAVGLTTVLAAVEATGTSCDGLAPWLDADRDGDLLAPLGRALSRLYAGPARTAPAGPLAFCWLARAALPFEPEFRPHTTPEVQNYFAELRALRSAPPPQPSGGRWQSSVARWAQALAGPGTIPRAGVVADPVLAFLRARLGPRETGQPRATGRRDTGWAEWVRWLFNGSRHAWTRGGAIRLALVVLLITSALAGSVLWWRGSAAVAVFQQQYLNPLRRSLEGRE
jgi:hypothetical protein